MTETNLEHIDEPVADAIPVFGKEPPLHVKFVMSMRWGILRKLWPIWAVSLVVSLIVVWSLDTQLSEHTIPLCTFGTLEWFAVIALSFISMYLNTALGMGYGVTMVPLMLFLFTDKAIDVIPILLLVQVLSEFASGLSHQTAGNIDLSKGSRHLNVALVLGGCGLIGGPLAVKLFLYIRDHSNLLNFIIGVLVFLVGISIFVTMGRRFRFSWRKIVILGIIASFIKGTTGSGYGPIVTGGQILTGVGGKQSIGIKTLAEGITCLTIVMMFLASGTVHDFSFGYPMAIGAVSSIPVSAWTVRKTGSKKLTLLIASVTTVMGVALIIKTLIVKGILHL